MLGLWVVDGNGTGTSRQTPTPTLPAQGPLGVAPILSRHRLSLATLHVQYMSSSIRYIAASAHYIALLGLCLITIILKAEHHVRVCRAGGTNRTLVRGPARDWARAFRARVGARPWHTSAEWIQPIITRAAGLFVVVVAVRLLWRRVGQPVGRGVGFGRRCGEVGDVIGC